MYIKYLYNLEKDNNNKMCYIFKKKLHFIGINKSLSIIIIIATTKNIIGMGNIVKQ